MNNKEDSNQTNGKIHDPNSGQAAKPVAHHALQNSKILMRRAVKRPQSSLKQRLKAQGQLDIVNPGEVQLPARMEKRLQHAKQMPKSELISHFSSVASGTETPAAAAAPPSLTDGDGAPRPNFKESAKPKPDPKRPLTTSEILEHALNQATAHENKPLKRSNNRLKKQLGIVAGVTVAVGLLTVVAVKSLPGAQLQVAAAKAGFSAKLPNYEPAGFSQAPLNSSPGEIAAQFQSQTDARNYTITQKTTSWDSTALANNFVARMDPNYHTVKSGDNIIYIYSGHNATWVNGGIWYNVQANGALTDQQLVELATSL